MKLQIATHKNIINVDLPETQINEFIIKIKQAEKDYKRKQKETPSPWADPTKTVLRMRLQGLEPWTP